MYEFVGKFLYFSYNKGDEKIVGVGGCYGYIILIILNVMLL